jgi:hypothetical protein
MGGACSKYEGDEEYIQNFLLENLKGTGHAETWA